MAVCKPTTLAAKYGSTMLTTESPVFQDRIQTFAEIIRKQQNPVESFDRTTLLSITRGLNSSLRRVDLTNFPTLANRVAQGNILYTEIGDFLTQSSFNEDEVNSAINTFVSELPEVTSSETIRVDSPFVTSEVLKVLDQLDYYYSENAANNISGGFCSAFANPFGQILEIVSAIQVGQDLLSKLLNFSVSFDLASLLNPLNAIKELLLKVVDQVKEAVMAQLNSIISSVTGIVNQLKDMAENAMAFFHSKIQSIRNFLNDISIDKIKETIDGFISDAVAQFEELTPEAIALMLFRFCQFSEMIQSFMQSPIDALRNTVSNFAASAAFQLSRGLEQTQRAVAAGATRFDEDARRRLREEAIDRASPNRDQPSTPRDRGPDGEFYRSVEGLSDQERTALSNLTREGLPGKFYFDPGVWAADGDLGFTEVRPQVWVKFVKVINRLQRMGLLRGELRVNNAYRTRRTNAAMRARNRNVAQNSYHMSGLALDVSMRALTRSGGGSANPRPDSFQREFIRVASQEGFTGIGPYNTFIHIDTDTPRRYWQPHHTRHQSWLETHASDGFRNGSAPQAGPSVGEIDPLDPRGDLTNAPPPTSQATPPSTTTTTGPTIDLEPISAPITPVNIDSNVPQ